MRGENLFSFGGNIVPAAVPKNVSLQTDSHTSHQTLTEDEKCDFSVRMIQ